MKKKFAVGLFVVLAALFAGGAGFSTPSTTYWTPCVMDVQPAGVWHLTYDTYNSRKAGGDLPADLGLTYGFRLGPGVNAEIGFDWFSRSVNPVYFNFKIGVPEGAISTDSPGIGLGIFSIGTKKGVSDYNVLDLTIGKTVGKTRLHAGYYNGDDSLLVDAAGKKDDDGFMFAFDYGFDPVEDADGSYNRFVLAGDWMSGDNFLGGGGVGLYWYFTRNASVLTGPVWYNEAATGGEMRWTMQLDINF